MVAVRAPVIDADERETLLACLDYLRERVVAKVEGVPNDAARRPAVASGTSLLWLMTHLTAAEINQFQRVFSGADVPYVAMPADDTLEAAVIRYTAACHRSREIVGACPDLNARAAGSDRHGQRPTLRWILVHMVEETARHAGHIDILREQLDGTVGR